MSTALILALPPHFLLSDLIYIECNLFHFVGHVQQTQLHISPWLLDTLGLQHCSENARLHWILICRVTQHSMHVQHFALRKLCSRNSQIEWGNHWLTTWNGAVREHGGLLVRSKLEAECNLEGLQFFVLLTVHVFFNFTAALTGTSWSHSLESPSLSV